jgi:TRAP-type mannitol/chloroaromatic compound transport system substrate-binding protein
MKRREFIKKAGAGAIAAGAMIAGAPAVHAQKTVEITLVTTWPRDFPGLGTGAQRFAKRLSDMTNGRMKVNYFADLIPSMRLPPAIHRCIMPPIIIGKASTRVGLISPVFLLV